MQNYLFLERNGMGLNTFRSGAFQKLRDTKIMLKLISQIETKGLSDMKVRTL